MKTILVTGGSSGLGKGIALELLKNGNRVVVIGSSFKNREKFYSDAKKLGREGQAFYIQADLSLVKENERVIEEVREKFKVLDMVIFCASKHNKCYTETKEGVEFTFALDYLSRFILSYGLKQSLEKSKNPMIINICGTGMKGKVNWDDLQFKNNFVPQKVMMHGSRLNDLLGVQFIENDTVNKIKYIMYNPWAVQTPGMMEFFNSPMMKLMYKIIGKPVEKAVIPISELINNPPQFMISAYRERKALNINNESYNKQNAKKLYTITNEFLKQLKN